MLRSLGIFVLLLGVAGCGGPKGPAEYPVTGKVTFDGEPLTDAYIIFRDPAGRVASGAGRVQNGEYSLKAQPGKKRVEITASRPVPGKFDESNPGEKVPVVEQFIPGTYNESSTLERTVEEGSNEFNFELTSDGK